MEYKGFVRPIIDSTHYVLGAVQSLAKDIIQSDGQWDSYLPVTEEQNKNGLETYSCTSFNTLNCIEILFKKIYDESDNFSDRFTSIEADIFPPGQDPHIVAQSIRNDGIIPEEMLPFSPDIVSLDEYHSFFGHSENDCLIQAKKYVDSYETGHEWVYTNPQDKKIRTELIKQALQYSPVGASVTAWHEENGVYVDGGQPNCHWTCIYGYNDMGWKCFDSYSPFLKIISFDHNIEYAKRYSLTKKQIKTPWWQRFIALLGL